MILQLVGARRGYARGPNGAHPAPPLPSSALYGRSKYSHIPPITLTRLARTGALPTGSYSSPHLTAANLAVNLLTHHSLSTTQPAIPLLSLMRNRLRAIVACRRYWTEGGTLRNVPVGGGSRKNKRSTSSKTVTDLTPPSFSQSSSQNPKIREEQDLNLAFPATQNYHNISEFVELTNLETNHSHNPSSSSSTSSLLELLRTGITSRGLNSFMSLPVHDSNMVYSSGFPPQEVKQTLNFSLDGLGNGYGSPQGVQESSGRLLFPFEESRQVSSTTEVEHNRGQGDPTGYWNGMLGGGSW
ncbi:hypothetical protein HHK36_000040 [Tetracentron sinense]|uniref:Dof-type domain-containing protein n=1 Tax=Tetracentron sinense TaxID=13715 RepID=A0A835A0B5_TETSI|nr:hypothetical protein HHK36_000040 [Tetracentron sinense]